MKTQLINIFMKGNNKYLVGLFNYKIIWNTNNIKPADYKQLFNNNKIRYGTSFINIDHIDNHYIKYYAQRNIMNGPRHNFLLKLNISKEIIFSVETEIIPNKYNRDKILVGLSECYEGINYQGCYSSNFDTSKNFKEYLTKKSREIDNFILSFQGKFLNHHNFID